MTLKYQHKKVWFQQMVKLKGQSWYQIYISKKNYIFKNKITKKSYYTIESFLKIMVYPQLPQVSKVTPDQTCYLQLDTYTYLFINN